MISLPISHLHFQHFNGCSFSYLNRSKMRSKMGFRPCRCSLQLLVVHPTLFVTFVAAYPRKYQDQSQQSHPQRIYAPPICRSENIPSFFDYSAKERVHGDAPMCPLTPNNVLLPCDDYSCSESKPCSKKTGCCNYGPQACGTNGQSPNDACWSKCDAHAKCGINAKVPGTKCPLNVCCSQYGFCGLYIMLMDGHAC